jgi:hypothetical protein
MLDEACPDAFSPDLIMSSKDGAAEELVPDVLEKWEAAQRELRRFTFEEALEGFLATSPEERGVVQERIVNQDNPDYRQTFSDYDIKLFMMMRMLERSRQHGASEMQEEPPQGDHEEEWTAVVHPEAPIMLFDDAVQNVMLGHDRSLQYVNVKRFRHPDDIY